MSFHLQSSKVSVCFRTPENARHHRTAKPRLTKSFCVYGKQIDQETVKNHIFRSNPLHGFGTKGLQIGSSGFESSSVASAAELKARFFLVFLGFTFCSGSCNLESDELNNRSKWDRTGPLPSWLFWTSTYTNSCPGTRWLPLRSKVPSARASKIATEIHDVPQKGIEEIT